MTTSSSSTVPGASDDAQSNGPLSLDALFSAELSGGRPADTAGGDAVAAPHHSDDAASSPEDFATPASSDSPEDPEDVDHEDEADDVDRNLPEADPEDEADDSEEDDGVDIEEDEVDGHAPFIDSDVDSDDGQRDNGENAKTPRGKDKREVVGDQQDDEITFADLGLPGDLLKAVTDMGFVTPTAIQKEAIPVLLAGRDVVGVAQTGTGKTAAFGLPLLDAVDSRDGVVQALVLAPTRELALQSAEAITDMASRSRGLDVVAVYGGAPYGPQIGALKGGAQVVVGTPGRVIDLIDKGALQLDDVRYFVLDEADEMLDLGFLPDVEKILARTRTDRHTMLFSATMPGAVVALARRYMTRPTHIRAQDPGDEGMTVQTVQQVVYRTHSMNKVEVVSRILQAEGRGRTIIFARTKRTAARVADDLRTRGFAPAALHGDLGQGAREQALRAFRNGKVDVLVATDVAARGIDVDDVTHVINYQCPEDEKIYVHRIGRTGRAGNSGTAVTFVDWDDVPRWRIIAKALGLPIEEPVETYHTSKHLFSDLSIPEKVTGRLPRHKRTLEGLDAEEIEDLGETGRHGRKQPGRQGGRGERGRGRGRDAKHGERSRSRRSDAGEPAPRRKRTRKRTRGGRPVDGSAGEQA